MTVITLDIETVPAQREDLRQLAAEGVRPPGTLKKSESIAEWEATQRAAAVEQAVESTSFDGGLGQIVVIGWAVDDQAAQSERQQAGNAAFKEPAHQPRCHDDRVGPKGPPHAARA